LVIWAPPDLDLCFSLPTFRDNEWFGGTDTQLSFAAAVTRAAGMAFPFDHGGRSILSGDVLPCFLEVVFLLVSEAGPQSKTLIFEKRIEHFFPYWFFFVTLLPSPVTASPEYERIRRERRKYLNFSSVLTCRRSTILTISTYQNNGKCFPPLLDSLLRLHRP
jgi:hypothetical protein